MAVSRLESELELVRALLLAQKQQVTVPFRKLGPYYGEPGKKFDDRDWWKPQRPWMVTKPCRDTKDSLGPQLTEIYFDEAAHTNPELNFFKASLDSKGNLTMRKIM